MVSTPIGTMVWGRLDMPLVPGSSTGGYSGSTVAAHINNDLTPAISLYGESALRCGIPASMGGVAGHFSANTGCNL